VHVPSAAKKQPIQRSIQSDEPSDKSKPGNGRLDMLDDSRDEFGFGLALTPFSDPLPFSLFPHRRYATLLYIFLAPPRKQSARLQAATVPS